ncbi:MAG TPA: A24 family peptidase [Gammaproteobacteria bacterium]|nr:A24 family peptidase [Gammaproteobacteria bacterium]
MTASDIILAFQLHPWLLYTGAVALGLLVGSFLNVVIHRLPIMMEREWKQQCEELAGKEPVQQDVYNLVRPRSGCPQCGHKISAWENIPVISYLLLGGRCAGCKTRISPQYPLVELLSAALSAWVISRFGPGLAGFSALLLTWALIALSVIDIRHTLLPDDITLPFLWLGLLCSIAGIHSSPVDAILGAALGYGSLYVIFHVFKWVTGKDGMGFGDLKLFALFGAWLGWQALPGIILLSSLVGAVSGLALILFAGRNRQLPIPFGPFLSVAGWLYLMYGKSINEAYLNWMKI